MNKHAHTGPGRPSEEELGPFAYPVRARRLHPRRRAQDATWEVGCRERRGRFRSTERTPLPKRALDVTDELDEIVLRHADFGPALGSCRVKSGMLWRWDELRCDAASCGEA